MRFSISSCVYCIIWSLLAILLASQDEFADFCVQRRVTYKCEYPREYPASANILANILQVLISSRISYKCEYPCEYPTSANILANILKVRITSRISYKCELATESVRIGYWRNNRHSKITLFLKQKRILSRNFRMYYCKKNIV